MRKYKKILFVCTGNTCRSPMAEIILKTKLKGEGVEDFKVWSAGLNTENGLKMSENSKKALKLLGYKPYNFKSRQLTKSMLDKSDYVICMTNSHKDYIAERVNNKNIYTMDEVTGIGEVTDPYGGNINAYIKSSHQLEDGCNIILEQILIKER